MTAAPDPVKGIVLYNLACFYATHGQLEKAAAMLPEALRLAPHLRGVVAGAILTWRRSGAAGCPVLSRMGWLPAADGAGAGAALGGAAGLVGGAAPAFSRSHCPTRRGCSRPLASPRAGRGRGRV